MSISHFRRIYMKRFSFTSKDFYKCKGKKKQKEGKTKRVRKKP